MNLFRRSEQQIERAVPYTDRLHKHLGLGKPPSWGNKVEMPTQQQMDVQVALLEHYPDGLEDDVTATILRCVCGVYSVVRRIRDGRTLPNEIDTNLADTIMTATCLKMLRAKRVSPDAWLGVSKVALDGMPPLPPILNTTMHDFYFEVCAKDLDPLAELRKVRGDERGASAMSSEDEASAAEPGDHELPTLVNAHIVRAMMHMVDGEDTLEDLCLPHFTIEVDEHLLVSRADTDRFERTIHKRTCVTLDLLPNSECDLIASLDAHWQNSMSNNNGDVLIAMRCMRNQPDTIAIRLAGPVMNAKMNVANICSLLYPEGIPDHPVGVPGKSGVAVDADILKKWEKRKQPMTSGASLLCPLTTDKWHKIDIARQYKAEVFGADLPGSNPDYVLVGVLELGAEEGCGDYDSHRIWMHKPWVESSANVGEDSKWCEVGLAGDFHKFPSELESVPAPDAVVVGEPTGKRRRHAVLFYRNAENLKREEACTQSIVDAVDNMTRAHDALTYQPADLLRIVRNSPFCRSELYHVARYTMRAVDAADNLKSVVAMLACVAGKNQQAMESMLRSESLTSGKWAWFKNKVLAETKKPKAPKGPKPPKPAPAPAPKPTKAEGKRAAIQSQREVERELEKARAEQAAALEAAAEARRAEEAKRVAEAHAAFQAKKAEQDAKAEAEAKAKDDAAMEAQKAKEARIAARRAAALERKAEGKAERAGGPKKTAFQLQAEHEAAEKQAREDAEKEAIRMNAEREARQAAERERARAEQEARNAAAEARKARERAAKEAKREAAREAAKAKAAEAAELAAAIKVAQVAEAEEAAAARARAERAARANEEEAEVRRIQLARLEAARATEERGASDTNGPECIVCFERARTHFGAVCGHMALCAVCADSMTTCPSCRVVTPFRRLFVV